MASGGSITVTALSNEAGGCGAFQVLPTSALGYHYMALVGKPHASSIHPSQLGILAVQDATKVIVRLKHGSGIQFFFNNTFYRAAPGFDQLVVTLNKGETFQVRTILGTADVSGVQVISKKHVSSKFF